MLFLLFLGLELMDEWINYIIANRTCCSNISCRPWF